MTRRFALLLLLAPAWAQVAPIAWQTPVQDKNFYLLSLMQRDANVRASLLADPALRRIAETKRDALTKAAAGSCADAACYANALKFTDDEIAIASRALAAVQVTLDAPMRTSGQFQRYHSLAPAEMLSRAWTDAARGVNRIVDVYASGSRPRYPDSDAIAYDPASPNFARLLRIVASVLADDSAALELFFEPSLQFAMKLLEVNRRDEAGRLEPLHLGENAAPYARIRTIDWTRYRYPAIVVPGSGNDREGVALSPIAHLRLELAARRFRAGLAPLLIVSGGYVHPNQTPYNEAVEMKRALIAEFGIPAEAILIEPHARHTTTNLRNASRLLFRYGIPTDRASLIVTDVLQNDTIASPAFGARCERELGYMPIRVGQRLSPRDLEFLPLAESLHADASDPLDP